MPNQYKNKVIYNSQTLIDLTSDTVTPETLVSGATAHDASGAAITGTYTGTEWTSGIYQDSDGFIRISPLPAAGGVYQDEEGYIVLAKDSDSSYIDGNNLEYGTPPWCEVYGLPFDTGPLTYGANRDVGISKRPEYEHTYRIVLDATVNNSSASIYLYLGSTSYGQAVFSAGQDGEETIDVVRDRDIAYEPSIYVYVRYLSGQSYSAYIRSITIYDVTEENNE